MDRHVPMHHCCIKKVGPNGEKITLMRGKLYEFLSPQISSDVCIYSYPNVYARVIGRLKRGDMVMYISTCECQEFWKMVFVSFEDMFGYIACEAREFRADKYFRRLHG